MSHSPTWSTLPEELTNVPPGRRGALLQAAASFSPRPQLEAEFAVGNLRARFADFWEQRFGESVPIAELRSMLQPPIPIGTVLLFSRLNIARSHDVEQELDRLFDYLFREVSLCRAPMQQELFAPRHETQSEPPTESTAFDGKTVDCLDVLLKRACQYPTIYADPPWSYANSASRGAAENHYPTMSLEAISALPVNELAAENAHLHLWTTNGFLKESFHVIESWGFRYKSCFVWVKDEIGMGNYWRVSHEFLMLGVRGRLTFEDRTLASWTLAPRTIHSRKPGVIRRMIEKASPGPYLELFGREALPDSRWTVFGNQVEPQLL